MLIGKIILLLLACAFVYAEDESDSHVISTEKYESKFEVISDMYSDGDEEKGFIAMAAEQSGSEPNSTQYFSELIDVDAGTEITTASNDKEIQEARREIKEWVYNLDCDTSSLGPFKCSMVKQMAEKFFKHTDPRNIDQGTINKISPRIKKFIKRLEGSNTQIDDSLQELIQKYRKLLV